MKQWLTCWLLGLAATAGAQSPAAADNVPARIATERERLQRERSVIEQTHEARKRDCWQRFAVNDCLREVRRSQHAALDPIRQQELQLNAQERAWRVQQRDERLREKQEQPQAQERRP